MQIDKSCSIVEQYLAYLIIIKGRSKNTILEYRLDLLQFFRYVKGERGILIFNMSTLTISVQLVLAKCTGSLPIARILFTLLPAQGREKLFPSGNFGSTSKPKCI